MRVITESDLRTKYYKNKNKNIYLQKKDFLTQTAKEYIKEKDLKIKIEDENVDYKVMKQENNKNKIKQCYLDENGNSYDSKPEHMTALNGNILVLKNHPRIVLRGKIDTLQSKILEAQIIAEKNNYFGVVNDLEEVLKFARDILASEVKETTLSIPILLGLDDESLRIVSHNPKKNYGIDHYTPNYKMGQTAIMLNSVRVTARETELSGINAFTCVNGTLSRLDIIRALNRLSSAIYIISCRLLSNYYNK